MLTHLGGALGGATSYFGLPGGNVIIPLIIWMLKKDKSAFLDDQGKEVLNFQICILILSIICIISCIGIVLLVPLSIAAMIFGIVGGIKANEGATYRYPLNWRIIK
jgi:uncharacterized Tic20 family protein